MCCKRNTKPQNQCNMVAASLFAGLTGSAQGEQSYASTTLSIASIWAFYPNCFYGVASQFRFVFDSFIARFSILKYRSGNVDLNLLINSIYCLGTAFR